MPPGQCTANLVDLLPNTLHKVSVRAKPHDAFHGGRGGRGGHMEPQLIATVDLRTKPPGNESTNRALYSVLYSITFYCIVFYCIVYTTGVHQVYALHGIVRTGGEEGYALKRLSRSYTICGLKRGKDTTDHSAF